MTPDVGVPTRVPPPADPPPPPPLEPVWLALDEPEVDASLDAALLDVPLLPMLLEPLDEFTPFEPVD